MSFEFTEHHLSDYQRIRQGLFLNRTEHLTNQEVSRLKQVYRYFDSFGNHEGKLVLMASFRPKMDVTVGVARRLMTGLQGEESTIGDDTLPRGYKVPYSYCELSFNPNGLLTRSAQSERVSTVNDETISDDVRALSGHLLDWSTRYPYALSKVLGTSTGRTSHSAGQNENGGFHLLPQYRQSAIRHAIIEALINNDTIISGGSIRVADLLKDLKISYRDSSLIGMAIIDMAKKISKDSSIPPIITYDSAKGRGPLLGYRMMDSPPSFDEIASQLPGDKRVYAEVYDAMINSALRRLFEQHPDSDGYVSVKEVREILERNANSAIHQHNGETNRQKWISEALRHLQVAGCLETNNNFTGFNRSRISLTQDQLAALQNLNSIINGFIRKDSQFISDGINSLINILGLDDVWNRWNDSNQEFDWWDYLKRRPYGKSIKVQHLLEKAYESSAPTHKFQTDDVKKFMIEQIAIAPNGLSTVDLCRKIIDQSTFHNISRRSVWRLLHELKTNSLISSVQGNNEIIWHKLENSLNTIVL